MIFALLLILLPVQLGYHFWPAFAYVNGIRVDYFSPTLYLTDILVGILFLQARPKILANWWLLAGVAFALVNIAFSLSPAVSFYKWLKVAEMGFLVWYVGRRAKFEAKWLLVPVGYEAILAIWQWWQQASVGGLWYLLGERTFSGGTPGIANAYINGALTLRPYGTFSHPNVLGGFLAVVLALILPRSLHNSRKLIAVGLGYLALFLSMSRAAIIVGLGAAGWIWRQKAWFWGLLLAAAILVWPRFGALGVEIEPLVVRQQLNSLAIAFWARSPIWGTGLGTAPLYSTLLQPTHNLYLLVLAETGILGILALGLVIWRVKLWLPLITILVLGPFDHYFLTLQQGQLLLALVLGRSFARINDRKKGGDKNG